MVVLEGFHSSGQIHRRERHLPTRITARSGSELGPRIVGVKVDRAFGEPENLRDRRASMMTASKSHAAPSAADIPLLLRRLKRALGSAVVAADPAMLFPL